MMREVYLFLIIIACSLPAYMRASTPLDGIELDIPAPAHVHAYLTWQQSDKKKMETWYLMLFLPQRSYSSPEKIVHSSIP